MLRRTFFQALASLGLTSHVTTQAPSTDLQDQSVAGTIWKGIFQVSGGPSLRGSIAFQVGETLTLSNPDEDPGGRVGLGNWEQHGSQLSLKALQFAADGTYAVILLQGTVTKKTFVLQGTSTDYNEQGQSQGSFNITATAVQFF